MEIETVRFGKVEINDNKILEFSNGLPGLEEYKYFAVLQFEDSYPIYWLQSTEDGDVCLPVVDSFAALPEYAFELSDEDVEELGLESHEDLHVISVLVIPESIELMTANLAAPVIINVKTGKAKQVILGGSQYNVRHPVFAEIARVVRGEENANAGTVKED